MKHIITNEVFVMEKFIILADVTCDLSEDIRKEFGVEDYIPGHVSFSDGRDIPTTLDWTHISREDFYKTLSSKKLQVSTAPASPEEYYLYFKKYVEAGYKILSISISSKISSTYNVACKAAERVLAEFPEGTIHCVDSLRMSGAMGLLVMHAHKMKQEGASFDEIVAWLENNKRKVHQMGPIDDLIFVARRGRISMGKAIMGNFAGVKPMGDCSSDGYVSVMTKVKGISKALDITVRYISKMATDIEDQYILISHSDRQAYAEKLAQMVADTLHPKKVYISDVFPGCGTNIGPGMVGAYFLGNEITEEQETEKACLNAILEG